MKYLVVIILMISCIAYAQDSERIVESAKISRHAVITALKKSKNLNSDQIQKLDTMAVDILKSMNEDSLFDSFLFELANMLSNSDKTFSGTMDATDKQWVIKQLGWKANPSQSHDPYEDMKRYLYALFLAASKIVYPISTDGKKIIVDDDLAYIMFLKSSVYSQYIKRSIDEFVDTNGVTAYLSDGDDNYTGDSGDNFIYGNKGDDILQGGDGEDSYHFFKGDGHDTIIDYNDYSYITFSEISKEDITIKLKDDGTYLILVNCDVYDNCDDTITVRTDNYIMLRFNGDDYIWLGKKGDYPIKTVSSKNSGSFTIAVNNASYWIVTDGKPYMRKLVILLFVLLVVKIIVRKGRDILNNRQSEDVEVTRSTTTKKIIQDFTDPYHSQIEQIKAKIAQCGEIGGINISRINKSINSIDENYVEYMKQSNKKSFVAQYHSKIIDDGIADITDTITIAQAFSDGESIDSDRLIELRMKGYIDIDTDGN